MFGHLKVSVFLFLADNLASNRLRVGGGFQKEFSYGFCLVTHDFYLTSAKPNQFHCSMNYCVNWNYHYLCLDWLSFSHMQITKRVQLQKIIALYAILLLYVNCNIIIMINKITK